MLGRWGGVMANYHLEVSVISRGKGRSVTKLANYVSGRKLYDSYHDKTYYRCRSDVLYCEIFLPSNAPAGFYDLQFLCNNIECAEKRYDARTAREFKCSLPNELPVRELKSIVSNYIASNFLSHNLCAIAAIHEGRNDFDPSRNNPHAHLIVPTRAVGEHGFMEKKDRDMDKRENITIWREQWAQAQNRAYERNHLDIRVSHESLEVQGVLNYEPASHMSRIDWQKEKLGECTASGDRRRAIQERNDQRIREAQQLQARMLDIELSR